MSLPSRHLYERKVDPDSEHSLGKLSRLVKPGTCVLQLGPATGYFTRYLTKSLSCVVDCDEYSAKTVQQDAPADRPKRNRPVVRNS